MTQTGIPHDVVKLPDPASWLEPALAKWATTDTASDIRNWHWLALADLVAAVLPTLAAAVLEAEALVIEQPDTRTDLSGGAYLRYRAERYRTANQPAGTPVPVMIARDPS